MSMIAMSGCSSLTRARRSSALPTCATTSKPSWSRRRARLSRISTASSARTTRNGRAGGSPVSALATSGLHIRFAAKGNLRVQPGALARRALDSKRPIERFDSIAQANETGARGGVSATDAVVGDVDDECVVHATHRDGDARSTRVFGDVGQGLRSDEVRSGFDGRRESRGRQRLDLDRQRGPPRERLHGRAESLLGQDGGVDPAGQSAKLIKGLSNLVLGLAEELLHRGRALTELAARQTKGEPDSEQALL